MNRPARADTSRIRSAAAAPLATPETNAKVAARLDQLQQESVQQTLEWRLADLVRKTGCIVMQDSSFFLAEDPGASVCAAEGECPAAGVLDGYGDDRLLGAGEDCAEELLELAAIAARRLALGLGNRLRK